MNFINTSVFMGLAIWVLGFALMTTGWLVDVLFERYGVIVAKIFYKTCALIVAVPVIYLLWKAAGLLFTRRVAIVLFLRGILEQLSDLSRAF